MRKDVHRLVAISLAAAVLAACSSRGALPTQPQAISENTNPQAISRDTNPNASTAPFHVETWSYDDYGSIGSGASASLVSHYITYAEGGSTLTDKALADCHTVAPGCKAVKYIDPNRVYVGENKTNILSVASENWWLHIPGYHDSGHRLQVHLDGKTGYILNQSVAAVQVFWKNWVRANYNLYDGLAADDTTGGILEETYGTGYRSSEEITTDAQVQGMHRALESQLLHVNGVPFFVVQNSINPDPFLPNGLSLLGNPANIRGVSAEGHPLYNNAVNVWYPNLLDLMAQVNRTPGFIMLHSYGSGGLPAARYLHTATFWLGYAPGHEVNWEDLAGNNDLTAWPEETIYPTSPLQSMSSGNTNLLVASNVWRREFGACYLAGRAWGHCAALVNLNSSPVGIQSSWLKQTYSQTIEVVGGDAQHSGAVTLGTRQNSIPAHGALLLHG